MAQDEISESQIQIAKDSLKKMATPEFLKEISAMIRSRSPIIYLVTSEEKRVLEYFRHYTVAGGYRTFVWDCYNGILKLTSMKPDGLTVGANDPLAVLDWIIKEATLEESSSMSEKSERDDGATTKGNIYILLDFHRFLRPCNPDIERRLRTLSRMDSNTVVIIVGPVYESTPALDKEMRVIDFPYPNTEEIKSTLYKCIKSVATQVPTLEVSVKKREEDIIDSVRGLTFTEVTSAFGKSICMHRDLHIPTILREKQEVIRKTGILEFFKPTVGIDDVGGLGNLIEFLKLRKSVFTQDARDFGLPTPKGILLIGVPGCVCKNTRIKIKKVSEGKHMRIDK